MPQPVALVTGPTTGIGRAYASQLAAKGYDLVLVSRDSHRLGELAAELEAKHGAKSEVLPADLADPASRKAVVARLEKGVDLLVNNAGLAGNKNFWEESPERLLGQVNVNVMAVTELTRAALGPMVEADKGAIINVSSLAAFAPGRGSTYSAAKSYVVYLTEGLSAGLAGTGVKFQVCCPGYVRTEFHERAGIDMSDMKEKAWITPDQVVEESLKDLETGKLISVATPRYKALYALGAYLPRPWARAFAAKKGRGGGRT